MLVEIAFLVAIVWFIRTYVFAEPAPTPMEFPCIYKDDAENKDREFYDVVIVGGGPSGSTCGFYLAQKHNKVAVLEKKQFPREKYCGDAVCKIAIEILMDMGIYHTLIKENKAHVADCGGMVSPSGISYIGRSHEVLGQVPAAIGIKRTDLDEAIARRAQKEGVDLKENWAVDTATFDNTTGLWSIKKEGSDEIITARVLVCADGAASGLGTKLGMITEAPQGTCSRAFIEGGSHNFTADGVVFYNKDLLPGYAALFRHPNGELNYCCYLIPGNPEVTNDKQKYWHDRLISDDPYVSKALGPNAKIESMKTGPLRLGGIQKSYGKHMILVGDAAGMIDPMTGEGIHHAMEGGKIAAEHLHWCIRAGNYSEECMKLYHNEWMRRFGFDFRWSMNICQLLFRFPILLDAATAAVNRKGNTFLARWADIMT
eukprot:Ihof_evm2s485 gene=Ihof_evmTU2s485